MLDQRGRARPVVGRCGRGDRGSRRLDRAQHRGGVAGEALSRDRGLVPPGDDVRGRRIPVNEHPPIAVALLNWNGWRDTIECLDTLARVRYPALDLYLCDNASTDDSVDRILAWAERAGWRPRVVRHEGDTFAGRAFARGTNIAMRYALASGRDYLALWALNTDTLVDPDAVAPAVAALLADPRAASVQSLLLGCPNDAVLDSAGIRLLRRGGAKDLLRGENPAVLAASGRREPTLMFGSCAASAFYRTTALQEVGLFDEALFQTNEDVDLACRLHAAGYHALLVSGSVVRHKGGVSRRRKQGRLWFIANRAKLRVVARWW